MINFEIKCYKCDKVLDLITVMSTGSPDFTIEVEPCEKCIEEATAEGYANGEADAQ